MTGFGLDRGSRDSPLILLLKPGDDLKCVTSLHLRFFFVLYPMTTLAVTPEKPSCSSAPAVRVPSSLFCTTGKCE